MNGLASPIETAAGRCGRRTVDCEHCRIRLQSVCSALAPDELAELEAIAQPVRFDSKETIFAEGDEAEATYTITCGTARLYRVFDDGRRQILGFMLPGDFLGLDLAPRRAFSADAIEPVNACRFPHRRFRALTERKPHLLRRLHTGTIRELTLAQDQAMALGRRTAEEKLAWFLIHLRDRDLAHNPQVALPMSRLDIADFLGLTIETVSRTFTRLAREKSVEILPHGVRLLAGRTIERLAAA